MSAHRDIRRYLTMFVIIALSACAPSQPSQNVTATTDWGTSPTNPGSQSAEPVASMGTLAYLDERNGFRDVSFGGAPLLGMRLVEDDGDEKFYTRPADDLSVGNGALASISYGYYKSQLFSVNLNAEGLVNSRALLDTLEAAYGKPYQPNEFMQRYTWLGSSVNALYDENPINGDSHATIMNKALLAADQAAGKQKAAGSARGF
jgi:hypothetical protein